MVWRTDEESSGQSKQGLLLVLRGPDSFKELKEGLHLFIRLTVQQTSTRCGMVLGTGGKDKQKQPLTTGQDIVKTIKMFKPFNLTVPLLGI